MFVIVVGCIVASMRDIDGRAVASLSEWSDLGVSELVPTGTVTLLMGDVEASTRLWDSAPSDMTAAIAILDRILPEAVTAHGGVRPIEQGEGDSFVVAFARASDAVACALALQRAALAPIKLRIGVHTGEVQLRDDANYVGLTINRAARVRDLAHGGQTVLSGTTADLVIDHLPAGACLTDLGIHHLRDLPRPERIAQLCYPDLNTEFPPLRTISVVPHNLPMQLTSFVGRARELNDVRQLLASGRLLTLTGAGGIGKTRLAQELSSRLAAEVHDRVWYVDLSPIGATDMVAPTVARVLGLLDQPGRAGIDNLIHSVASRHMLIVLDNCEHLLDACARLSGALLAACPNLTLLSTSREPLGVTGEIIWRVPSLAIADEALELFADRAALARPDFRIGDDTAAAAMEICRRLDGVPLAIELAAARVRALSLVEILDGLHDRFRLLAGARSAVQRQQTLYASVDWSHALLTEPERVLFRRLAAFVGGFDLDAAQLVAACGELKRHQVLDQLSLLVDKSLVIAEGHRGRTRYRMLETVRQFAQEKLSDAGEAETVRSHHRDYYAWLAAMLETSVPAELERRIEQADTEIDNLRAAFGWTLDQSEPEAALALASFLQPLWRRRGRIQEGLAWFDAALSTADSQGSDIAPVLRVRAIADRIMMNNAVVDPGSKDAAADALALARDIGEPALLLKALIAWCSVSAYSAQFNEESFTQAIDLARSLDDSASLCQIMPFRAFAALFAGDARIERAAAEEGRDIAESIGDQFVARHCRWNLGMAQMHFGELDEAIREFDEVIADGDACPDPLFSFAGRYGRTMALAFRGDTAAARATAAVAVAQATRLGDFMEGFGHAGLAVAALAAGDVDAAAQASEIARQRLSQRREFLALFANPIAEVALVQGDLATARRCADEAVRAASGWNAAMALTTRARIAAAEGDFAHAELAAHEALVRVSGTGARWGIADTVECLAAVAAEAGSDREAARLLGSAHAMRDRTGEVRFLIYDGAHQALVAALDDAMGDNGFEAAWAEGAALSTEEAIEYARRGRGERKRPSSGWAAVTPTELEVVKLVSDGLGNKDIATKLLISPRTVQAHLNHIYRKLGITSRLQLAKKAARQP
jgi:predicted ATPase/class 3 adenylate cyclase/DNA-binding CsgD family transcriptional regulator